MEPLETGSPALGQDPPDRPDDHNKRKDDGTLRRADTPDPKTTRSSDGTHTSREHPC